MKHYIIIFFLALTGLLYSCSKGSNPNPNDENVHTGDKPVDTAYTINPTQTINTDVATEQYNVEQKRVISTSATNGEGGGVMTKDGGTVKVGLMNVKDGDFSVDKHDDQLGFNFSKAADPIFEYIVKDDVKRTISKYDVHINKIPNSLGSFNLVGNSVTAFKGDTTTWTAVKLVNISKSDTQLIQQIVVK